MLSPPSKASTREGKGRYRSGPSHAVRAFMTEILKEAFVLVPKVVLENRNGCKLGKEKRGNYRIINKGQFSMRTARMIKAKMVVKFNDKRLESEKAKPRKLTNKWGDRAFFPCSLSLYFNHPHSFGMTTLI